ncbi:MAG: TolB family protein [Promethearchaeota archaeon]
MARKRYFLGLLLIFTVISSFGLIALNQGISNNNLLILFPQFSLSNYNIHSDDWASSGNAICLANETQTNIQIAWIGSGAIIVWQDNRSGNWDIYAQKVTTSGVTQQDNWQLNGNVICNATNNQTNPQVIPDGSGGAIIVWEDYRTIATESDIYAQRINETGDINWTTNGIVICNANSSQNTPQIISNSSGGAIITWCDNRSNSEDIYAQIIDINGQVQLINNGTVICNSLGNQTNPKLCSDLDGGAIIVWEDSRKGNKDIYAQLINKTGITAWDNNGTVICNESNVQQNLQVISDGNGSCIIVWEDLRYTNSSIFGQKINGTGFTEWDNNGTVICNYINNQIMPKLCNDNGKGAIISWLDNRTGNFDIYGQHVNSTGGSMWTLNGSIICAHPSNQINHQILNRSKGAIVVWADNRTASRGYGIFIQFLKLSGNREFGLYGKLICDVLNDQNYPKLCSDSDDGAIIAWEDKRSSIDIYAQRIDEYGIVGTIEVVFVIPYYVDARTDPIIILLVMLIFGIPLCTTFVYCLLQMRPKEKEEKKERAQPKAKEEKVSTERKHPRRTV